MIEYAIMTQSAFKELSNDEIKDRLLASPTRWTHPFVLFSTRWMGFTQDPQWLQVQMDDHGFHRGDGVFEAIKAVKGRPWLLVEHIERLWRSAEKIAIKPPLSKPEVIEIVQQAVQLSKMPETLIRIFLTRGPGGFSVNPLDCPEAHLYVIVMKRNDLPEEKFKTGVKVGVSQVPWKPGFFSQVKSLNYLPNVLMKAEANTAGVDFMVGLDSEGFVAEGPTENLVMLDSLGMLHHPRISTILKGCSMTRLFDLVEKSGMLKTNRESRFSVSDLKKAAGIFMVGTTLDVLPVSQFSGEKIPVSDWSPKLLQLIRQDQA